MKVVHNAKETAGGLQAYGMTLFESIRESVAFSMAKVEASAKKYIKAKDVIAEGDLFKSITWAVDVATSKIIGSAGTNLKYAPFVEFGTRPHWPPVDAIERWVETQRSRGKMRVDDVKSTAFLISRAIARRGTKAQPFMEVALRLNKQGMIKRVAAAIKGA